MNTIIIELCQEDRQRLDTIINLLGDLKPNCHKCVEAATANMAEGLKVVSPAAAPAPAPEHPVDEVSPHAQPEPAAEPAKPKYTKEDILAKVQSLAKPGSQNRAEAKAIVNDYGAKVSDIPEDKYDEVMARLTALEG